MRDVYFLTHYTDMQREQNFQTSKTNESMKTNDECSCDLSYWLEVRINDSLCGSSFFSSFITKVLLLLRPFKRYSNEWMVPLGDFFLGGSDCDWVPTSLCSIHHQHNFHWFQFNMNVWFDCETKKKITLVQKMREELQALEADPFSLWVFLHQCFSRSFLQRGVLWFVSILQYWTEGILPMSEVSLFQSSCEVHSSRRYRVWIVPVQLQERESLVDNTHDVFLSQLQTNNTKSKKTTIRSFQTELNRVQ